MFNHYTTIQHSHGVITNFIFYNNLWIRPIDSRHMSAVAGPPLNNLRWSTTICELRCAASGGLRHRRRLQPPCPNQASEILGLARPSAPSAFRSGLSFGDDLD
jgi:hypothetical protein